MHLSAIKIHVRLAKGHNFIRPYALIQDAAAKVVEVSVFGRAQEIFSFFCKCSVEFQRGRATLMDTIKSRQELWVTCKPWTEGLATLFDAVQVELFAQDAALTSDRRQAQARFLSLSEFERIAYTHLVDMRERDVNSQGFGHKDWVSLFRELDSRRVALDDELLGRARQVLDTVRRKGHQVENWEKCYATPVSISLTDGKTYRLRREVTHAVHNAAKKAAYQLGKIWKS